MEREFYQVHSVYKDGKDLNMNLKQDQLKGLFEALSSGKIYWSGDERNQHKNGFWTNLEDIRYIEFKTMQKEQPLPGEATEILPGELPGGEAEIK